MKKGQADKYKVKSLEEIDLNLDEDLILENDEEEDMFQSENNTLQLDITTSNH